MRSSPSSKSTVFSLRLILERMSTPTICLAAPYVRTRLGGKLGSALTLSSCSRPLPGPSAPSRSSVRMAASFTAFLRTVAFAFEACRRRRCTRRTHARVHDLPGRRQGSSAIPCSCRATAPPAAISQAATHASFIAPSVGSEGGSAMHFPALRQTRNLWRQPIRPLPGRGPRLEFQLAQRSPRRNAAIVMCNPTVCHLRRRKFRSFTRSSRSIRGKSSSGARARKTPEISDTTRMAGSPPRRRLGVRAAVGNPFSLGSITRDETVVDLGCGAGADLCIVASLIGDRGRAIGIDITPAMVDKAKENVRLLRLRNVEVHVADIAAVPLEDACADVVISNGAINLSPHKPCVFKEVFRILRPGGRFQFATWCGIALQRPRAAAPGPTASGTVEPQRYLDMLGAAGFGDAELVAWTSYRTAPTTIGATFRARKPEDRHAK